MKRKILSLLVFFVAIMCVAVAQLPASLMTTTDHYYSVMFDEEGEATVSLMMTLRNAEDSKISSLNLEIPGSSVSLIGVAQETTGYETQTCLSWATECTEYGEGQSCVQYDYNGNCVSYERPCLKMGQVCRSYRQNYNYQPSYQKINVQPVRLSHSVSLPITLITPVSPQGQTNIIVMYKVGDYATNSLGAYNFNFETVKTPYSSNNVRVAVNVQEGLNLKGTQARVNYLSNFAGMSKALESTQLSSDMSKEMYSYTRTIQYANGLVKTATYLDPLESFSVKGVYSRSWIRLYIDTILIVGLILFGVVGFLVYGTKKLFKYAQPIESKKQAESKHYFLVPFLVGLFTAIIISLLWGVSILVMYIAESAFGYGSGIFGFLVALFAILITLALLIGAPVYAGSKYGAATGVFTVISVLGWLFLFSIILVLVLSVFNRPVIYY
jgi:hypothetical protein